ncbi:uncharacterized protein DUF4381 [Bosea sp. AK1]|uniref:DUF4381 domain-containing protein n=1 Tax=Bosea sp. AK1 TaxID=2587160 RepID=UPI001150B2B1|nr:DUF4381 domain-containing protein [Bosea sp. AK1]TQI72425.1 uncharacterized protein DUF4381 [Bosea sp. AK1]
MSSDPGDLANMADLALPEPISFWPPAAGVWIVGVTVGAMLAVVAWRALRRYRADAYLRGAEAEIDALAGGGAETAEAVSAVLKRAAIVAYGREEVASLTGPGWATFIKQTTPAGIQTADLGEGLTDMFVPGARAPGESALVAQAKDWLRGQRGRAAKEA